MSEDIDDGLEETDIAAETGRMPTLREIVVQLSETNFGARAAETIDR